MSLLRSLGVAVALVSLAGCSAGRKSDVSTGSPAANVAGVGTTSPANPLPTPAGPTPGATSAQEYQLDTSFSTYLPLQSLAKPGYLQTAIDPQFGTRITRITGDVGDAITNAPGDVWREVARHGYSTRQPWNADESILYLGKNDTLGGGSGSTLFLDGETYGVIKGAGVIPGANERRWHPTDPDLILLLRDSEIASWSYSTQAVKVLVTFQGYTNTSMGYTGNFSNDASVVAFSARRTSDGRSVVFAVNLVTGTKYPDIDVNSVNVDYVTTSPLGTYVYVNGDFGGGSDRTRIYDCVTGAQVGSEWSEYGTPSHADVAIDQNGDEVAVGVDKTINDGRIIKRRLSDGAITVLTMGGYGGHTTARSLNRPGWVFTQTSDSTSWKPYLGEIIAVRLDGARVERVCNFRRVFQTYWNQAQPCASPSGGRVVFASDWGSGSVPIQAYVVDFRHLAAPANNP